MTTPPAMRQSFLLRYLEAFHSIEGWFSYDAALMFMAYNQVIARHGIPGDVFEIGVHHGLSTIAVAALRGSGSALYAADLFEGLQSLNTSRSGAGDRDAFERNMRRFFGDIGFVRILARPSREVTSKELGNSLSFCHVDGGHSREETLNDLKLCHASLKPGGLLALDDYFNVDFPGVSEGAVEFNLTHPGAMLPLAIGFNKVLFQKHPAPCDTNVEFLRRFPKVEHKIVRLWDRPAVLFTSILRSCFDLQASTPDEFHPFGSVPPRAVIKPESSVVRAGAGERVTLSVWITNKSGETFPHGDGVFGLSYHLLSGAGELLRHDNERAFLLDALAPGGTASCELVVDAPPEKGKYRLELDLVWEGVMWFRDIGNPTVTVDLIVR